VRLAICILLGIALVPAAASAPVRSGAHVVRWQVVAKVETGTQTLVRTDNPPGHSGGGSLTSSWIATWNLKVRFDGIDVHILPARAIKRSGTASGEYHGSYPVVNGTKSYSCPFKPIKLGQTVSNFRFYGVGRSDPGAKVTFFFGTQTEPEALPALTCTGDPVDSGVPRTVDSGLFTGHESGCLRPSAKLAGRKFLGTKPFGLLKEFSWKPTSVPGVSRPCSGFGSPIDSAGHGTLRLSFRRLKG
jgi:hypothetical protein